MAYHVRVLVTSDKVIPFGEIEKQGKSIKLVSGADLAWERIEIYAPEDNLICILERHIVSSGSYGESELGQLRESIQSSYPVSARNWLKAYFPKVKTIYTFQLFGERVERDGWPVLGRIQNLLRDLLIGIIQADNEGFYNESGDYILWRMFEGATGAIPAATLSENGEWITFPLKLTDTASIERFKEGQPPPRGFLSKIMGI
jgi:hypothetical protein